MALSFRFVFASEARGAVASARESRHTVATSDIPVSGVSRSARPRSRFAVYTRISDLASVG